MGGVEAGGSSYGVAEAAQLVGLSPDRVRRFARAGLLEARREPGGRLRLSFRDLSFLRRVRELDRARIAPRRVHRALARLRGRLQGDLSSVTLAAAAGEVVVREGATLWSPESGQCVFDFESNPTGPSVVSLEPGGGSRLQGMSALDWYQLGCELEASDRARAEEAYQLAVEADPDCADALVNLGCLEHEDGRLQEAEHHYREALRRGADATARFNLGVLCEDQQRWDEARTVYEQTLAQDPACAEAHYNLARLCDRVGDGAGVVRHLAAYRRLSEGRLSDD